MRMSCTLTTPPTRQQCKVTLPVLAYLNPLPLPSTLPIPIRIPTPIRVSNRVPPLIPTARPTPSLILVSALFVSQDVLHLYVNLEWKFEFQN